MIKTRQISSYDIVADPSFGSAAMTIHLILIP